MQEEITQPAKQSEIVGERKETLSSNKRIDTISTKGYKTENNANPILSNIFCADPTAVEYNGRLYVYGTNDQQQADAVGINKQNSYEKIRSFQVMSTDDMVNWTYHGVLDVDAVAPWIYNSWAPSIVSRVEEDGFTHFYLYFSNSGAGVGVITATNPLGPWTDPLGKSLIDPNTPTIGDCPNPFDPGVCIDEKGIGWLTFGGGKSKAGTDYMPGVARIVQLGKDMLSLDSDIVEIPAPYFFEASELNYMNDTWIYTYNTSWVEREEWNYEDIHKPAICSMAYMTSKTPLVSDSWEYRSHYFLNSGERGMEYSNNHTHVHKYKGKYYIVHHTNLLKELMGVKGGYRSMCVEELSFDETTLVISLTGATKKGVEQIKYIDPYVINQAATMFTSADMGFHKSNRNDNMVLKALEDGGWSYVKGVNFHKKALRLTANVKGTGKIEIRLDDANNEAVAVLNFDSNNWQTVSTELRESIIGVHNIYYIFSDRDVCMDEWQFQ
jgi:arabinoxylan arabinofuranohydrolase